MYLYVHHMAKSTFQSCRRSSTLPAQLGEVPAYNDAAVLCVRGDARHVEDLATVVLQARQEDQGSLVRVLVDGGEDLVGGDVKVVVRLDINHGLSRLEAVPSDLGFDRILPSLWSALTLQAWVAARDIPNHWGRASIRG